MVTTTSLSAQFFDRKWEGIEIARDSFGQNAVTDIGSGSNITLAGEWLGNSRDAGAIVTQEMSFLDQHYLTLSYRTDYSSALGSASRSIGYPGMRFSTRLDKIYYVSISTPHVGSGPQKSLVVWRPQGIAASLKNSNSQS